MTHQNLINNGFGSQYRKDKAIRDRISKREEILVKIMLVVLAGAILWSMYALDVIINRAIDLM